MIDLHLHLDGAITVDIAKKLASIQGITLPGDSDDELSSLLSVPENCESLNDFLKCFALPCSLMQTPEGLREAVRLVCDDLSSQGIVYAEIRFAPQLHAEKGMTQETAINSVLEGLKLADLKCNLILCFMRGEGNEEANLETLRLAKKYLVPDGGVVAADLAGAEALFPTSKYKDLFAEAKKMSIPFTIHAGEADGAESVRLAIEYGAKRVGHGVRITEDPELIDEIRDKEIVLEMCPTSNRQTRAVTDMLKYPLTDFLDKGLRVTLNTDDPAIERTTLEKEYEYMRQSFGLTATQERKLLENAIFGAFTTEQVKSELREKILV